MNAILAALARPGVADEPMSATAERARQAIRELGGG
jgi:hypothetical protein